MTMNLESIIGGIGSGWMRTKLSLWRRIATLSVSVFLLLMIAVVVVTGVRQCSYPSMQPSDLLHSSNNQLNASSSSALSSPHRRLLRRASEEVVEPNRIWGDSCSKSDIVINQGPTAPLPSGIPTYTVEIMNVCVNGCDIRGIHLNCGWFSSARLINPRFFKRLHYDDCLVNDGKPLVNGRTISFQYANTFRYPLSVASVTC